MTPHPDDTKLADELQTAHNDLQLVATKFSDRTGEGFQATGRTKGDWLAALTTARTRAAALAKLTPEERKALGLTSNSG